MGARLIMMGRVFVVGQLICLVSMALAQTPANRLPASITPINYALHLEPDMDNNTVAGTVMITFNTTNNQNLTLTSVVLHLGVDVTVDEDSVTLLELSGQKKTIGAIEYDDPNLLFKVALPDGDSLQYSQQYTIFIKFTSLLYSEPTGLFTGFINSSSKYIASNFRPTFARFVFPCFDEPQFKTPVTLQVLRPLTYFAVSTAPLDYSSEPTIDGMVLDTFMATPAISIHSLGLFISELSPVESPMRVNLYIPSGMSASVPFLQSLLDGIRTTVGQFPITPLKLVVLPDHLKMSLASYGFVFTSADIYGYNEQEPSYAAHVWASFRMQLAEAFYRQFLEFYKTPLWWSHLWLSESVGAFLASYVQPEIIPWLRVETRSEVLGVDFEYPTQAVINSQIWSHWDIEEAVTRQYIRKKGLGLLNMWNDTLPEGVIMKTITDYIKLPKLVVTTDDFLDILVGNIKANKTYDVTEAIPILPAWLNTAGYLTVSYLPHFSYNFQLTQHPDSKHTWVWPVSLSFAQNNTRDWNHYRQDLWFIHWSVSFGAVSGYDGNEWVIFNLESGLYRFDYGISWGRVQDALKKDLLPSTTPDSIKAALQDDAVAVSLQGYLKFSTAFAVLASTQRYMLDWFPVAKAFEAFTNRIGNDKDIYDQFSTFAATLFPEELLAMLDLQNKPADMRVQYIRSIMTPWLCEFNIGNFRQVVAMFFDQLLHGDIDKIDPGDLENVACYGAKYNNSALDLLHTAYIRSPTLQLRYLYTTGLGCLSDAHSVRRVLNLLVNSTSPFQIRDAKRIIVSLASKMENSATIIDFVSQQAFTIQSVLGSGCLGDLLLTLGKLRIDLSKVQYLSNDHSVDPYVIQSAVRAISRSNTTWDWWSKNAAELEAALPQKRKTTTTTTTESTIETTVVSSSEASTASDIPTVTTAITTVFTETTTTASAETTTAVSTATTAVPTEATTATTNGTTATTVSTETTTATTNGTTATTVPTETTTATTNGTTATANGTSTQGTTSTSIGTTSAPSSCPESLSNIKVFALILSSVIILISNN